LCEYGLLMIDAYDWVMDNYCLSHTLLHKCTAHSVTRWILKSIFKMRLRMLTWSWWTALDWSFFVDGGTGSGLNFKFGFVVVEPLISHVISSMACKCCTIRWCCAQRCKRWHHSVCGFATALDSRISLWICHCTGFQEFLVFNGVDGVMEGLELEPLISHMISSMADDIFLVLWRW